MEDLQHQPKQYAEKPTNTSRGRTISKETADPTQDIKGTKKKRSCSENRVGEAKRSVYEKKLLFLEAILEEIQKNNELLRNKILNEKS